MSLWRKSLPTAAVSFDGVVRHVHENGGSHIEPRFDEAWDDLTKLRWEAAVVEADTGLHVRVSAGGLRAKRRGQWVDVPDTYSVQVGHMACSSFSFDAAWRFLNGVSVGAREAARL